MIGLLVLVACEGPVQKAARIDLAAYAGLGEGRAWTWRDDGATDAPDPATLLHGEEDDSGIALRRGDRWEDATEVGHLGLALNADGLRLNSWTLDAAGDDSALLLALDGAVDGDVATEDGHSCTVTRLEPVTTYYATFDLPVQVDCENGTSLVLGEGFGLVAFVAADVALDLVAPY